MMNKPSRFLFWLIITLINAVAISIGWRYSGLLLFAFVFEVVIFLIFDKRKNDISWLVVPFFLGPSMEMIAIYGGAWTYGAPFVLGIPVWLPPAYGVMGLLLRRTVFSLSG